MPRRNSGSLFWSGLKATPALGEADRRVALLGEVHGLLWITARGARRSKKRIVGLLEPFTRGLFRLSRRKLEGTLKFS